jgi:glucan 1,3-beta-glucosidase
MNYRFITYITLLLLFSLNTLYSQATPSFSKLSIKDGIVVNEEGEKVFLKGCNVGNWLVLEMWMLSAAGMGIDDQYTMESIMTERFGEEEKDRLMELYRESWVGPDDFKTIRSFDMNVVRLPFSSDILLESNSPPTLRPDAFKWLDRAIEMAEVEGLYTILDMHGAPGKQSGMDHTGRVEYNKLWEEEHYQDATVWLWEKIVERYKDRPSIAAYDFLNEPWGGTHEGLTAIIDRLYESTRAIDPDTMIIIPGFYDGIDFYGDPRDKGWTNYMFTMHFYPGFFGWGRADWPVHAFFLNEGIYEWKERMDKLGVPLLVGEFNVVLKKAGGGEMMRRYYDRYEKWNWPATMWSYKVLTKKGGFEKGGWGMVSNANAIKPINVQELSREQIEEEFKKLATMPIEVNEDLRYWLTTADTPSEFPPLPPPPPKVTEPKATDALPAPWNVTDIGGSLAGGQAVLSPSEFEIYGGGNDIWAQRDQFRFVWQKLSGDFSLTTTIDDLDDVHTYAKAGLMVRKDLSSKSPYVLINVFPDGRTENSWRMDRAVSAQAKSGPGLQFGDAMLRLSRVNNTIHVEVSEDGSFFEKINELNIPSIATTAFVGLATLSHDNSQLVTAKYSNIELNGNAVEVLDKDLVLEEEETVPDQTSTGTSSSGGEKNTYNRFLEFAGRTWSVKAFDVPTGPGDNYFSDDPDHVWVDDEGLHLTIKQADDIWWCTEVILQETLGYGTYVFYTESDVDKISHETVLGLFTWDNYGDGPGRWPYREIDIEFARWGAAGDERNSQYCIQPWDGEGTSHRFRIDYPDPNDKRITTFWEWKEDVCHFTTARGYITPNEVTDENVISRWNYSGKYLQPPGRENVRLNFWIFKKTPPATDTLTEFIISDFKFFPPNK